MDWIAAVEHLRRTRRPGVLVTVHEVRGHAPREAGARLVVTADTTWGTVGGGSLEADAIDHARRMLARGARTPERTETSLSERGSGPHGVQCCGGVVTLVLDPLPVPAAVAVFGYGHVGRELARLLARHDLDLHLVDSRPGVLGGPGDAVPPGAGLEDAVARVTSHAAPVPEVVLGELPAGTHVLVLTHDHAEDLALVDMALRHGHLGSLGLIGSRAKWRRFAARLAAEGHPEEVLARVRTPIGLRGDGVPAAKDPATVALVVAAEVLALVEHEQAAAVGTGPEAATAAHAATGSPGRGGPE